VGKAVGGRGGRRRRAVGEKKQFPKNKLCREERKKKSDKSIG